MAPALLWLVLVGSLAAVVVGGSCVGVGLAAMGALVMLKPNAAPFHRDPPAATAPATANAEDRALLTWVKLFGPCAGMKSLDELDDGLRLASILSELHPRHAIHSSELQMNGGWRMLQGNLDLIVSRLDKVYKKFQRNVCIADAVDTSALAGQGDGEERRKLITLLLASICVSPRAEELADMIASVTQDQGTQGVSQLLEGLMQGVHSTHNLDPSDVLKDAGFELFGDLDAPPVEQAVSPPAEEVVPTAPTPAARSAAKRGPQYVYSVRHGHRLDDADPTCTCPPPTQAVGQSVQSLHPAMTVYSTPYCCYSVRHRFPGGAWELNGMAETNGKVEWMELDG